MPPKDREVIQKEFMAVVVRGGNQGVVVNKDDGYESPYTRRPAVTVLEYWWSLGQNKVNVHKFVARVKKARGTKY